MTDENSSTSRPVSAASRCCTSAAPGSSALLTAMIFGPVGQAVAVLFELAANGAVVFDRVGAVDGLGLDEVDQHARAFDVSQELVAQAGAGVGAFDQARDVGHDERAVDIELHDAEVRRFGRERIVGDFRAGARDAAQQRALAGVRFADEADVGDDFQLEREAARFAFVAARVLARGLVGGRFEARVAFAAFAAVGGDHLLAGRRQILQHVAVVGVHDDRAGRNADDQIFGAAAVAVGAAAVLAALGAPLLAMGERDEAIDARLGDHDDAAAVAAVAAVGTAARHVLLAAEAHAAVAAAAGFDFDGDAIDEHGRGSWRIGGRR